MKTNAFTEKILNYTRNKRNVFFNIKLLIFFIITFDFYYFFVRFCIQNTKTILSLRSINI